MPLTRAELRAHHLALRKSRDPDACARDSARIVAHLRPHLEQARVIAGYRALRGEPAIHGALDPSTHTIALPRAVGPVMTLHRWQGEPLERGVFGILQPSASAPLVDPSEVDLWLVPGLCFDRHGGRIGHGKGHYDRALANVRAPRLGIAWASQVVERVPTEPHDVPMTGIVTEEGWFATV